MPQIPQNFGKSKIKLLRGEQLHESRQKHRTDTDDMSFSIGGDLAPALVPPMSFNVLYIETPQIALLQTPAFQLLAETWQETVELVKPLLRFGFPETSLRTKCPYYNEQLHSTPWGPVLANDDLRKLMAGIEQGYQLDDNGHQHSPQQQQQQQHGAQLHVQQRSGRSSSSAMLQQTSEPLSIRNSSINSSSGGPFGIGSSLRFLAGLVKEQQQQQQQHGHSHSHSSAIPKSNLLMPEMPSGTLVLGLNLLAYWAISRQARSGFGG